jgi:hypothetical protein
MLNKIIVTFLLAVLLCGMAPINPPISQTSVASPSIASIITKFR